MKRKANCFRFTKQYDMILIVNSKVWALATKSFSGPLRPKLFPLATKAFSYKFFLFEKKFRKNLQEKVFSFEKIAKKKFFLIEKK
jgi:hypothetical protein